MRQQTRITPEKVTRPLQLLAAWLSGLIIIDGSFLAGASQIHTPEWAAALLVTSAVVNVPLFLFSIFLLQTKYRPEMQEDQYYARYLEHRYSPPPDTRPQSQPAAQSKQLVDDIVKEIGPTAERKKEQLKQLIETADVSRIVYRVGHRRALSELYLKPDEWHQLLSRYRDDEEFQEDLDTLASEGLITMAGSDLESCQLTALGREVAELAKANDILWHQKQSRRLSGHSSTKPPSKK